LAARSLKSEGAMPEQPEVEQMEEPMDLEEAQSSENFYTWKKNSPLLYDSVLTADLEWPSQTVQWFPDKTKLPDKPCGHRLLLGSDTSSSEQEYVKIGHVALPSPEDAATLRRKASEELQQLGPMAADLDQDIGGYSDSSREWNYKTTMRINHEGPVHRARYMPQNPTVMATKSDRASTSVFYLPKHPSEPTNSECKPDLLLTGHEDGGFGLSWSTFDTGKLASGGSDGRICIWNIDTAAKEDHHSSWSVQKTLQQPSSMEVVEWDLMTPHMFFSGSDDGLMLRWDERVDGLVQQVATGTGGLRSIAPNYYNEYLIATGGLDGVVDIWDLRNLSADNKPTPVMKLKSHTDEVLSTAWSPFHEKILCSASSDKLVHMWDLDTCCSGPNQVASPMFTHAGHRDAVCDIAWNLHDPFCLASVSLDNSLQIWTPAQSQIVS